MISFLFFYKNVICSKNVDYSHVLTETNLQKNTSGDLHTNEEIRKGVFDELRSHFEKAKKCGIGSLPPEVRSIFHPSMKRIFSLDYSKSLCLSALLCDFSDQSQFEHPHPLDPRVDYASSKVFDLFMKRGTYYATHYQILLNCNSFLKNFNDALREKGSGPIKILRGLLELGKSQPIRDMLELEFRAFSLYARALVAYYHIRYLRANNVAFVEQESEKVNLFRTFQVEYIKEICEEGVDRKQTMLEDIAFDLSDLTLEKKKEISIPNAQLSRMKSHGDIILLSNREGIPVSQDTCLEFNRQRFFLIGGQSTPNSKGDQTSFSMRAADILKKINGSPVLVRYYGSEKETVQLDQNELLQLDILYLERMK